jgi:hypothetical protein
MRANRLPSTVFPLLEDSMPIPRGPAVLLLAGGVACATIAHGTTQDVNITSNPSAARVMVDNKPLGSTPVVAKLARNSVHTVRLEVDGYKPFELQLQRKTSGWVWGNLALGGFIGFAVDMSNGAMYKLSPEEVVGTFASAGSASITRDGFFVTLVAHADSSWTRIATLEPTR